MEQKILIAADSTCDLSDELIARYGIKILPLGVTLGETQYRDGIDVTPDLIYENYEKTGRLPKTAAINLADFSDFFQAQKEEGNAVVFFTISALMSSTYQNAALAAQEFDNVYVVDTQNLSTGGGLLVLHACELAQSGMGAAEIAQACRDLAPCVDASFIVDSLEFLHKGGRCSAVAAFGANLLKLKPCITVQNGKMGVGKKYRGNFADVLQKYIAERIGDGTDLCTERVFVTHAGCDRAIVDACVAAVKARAPFQEVCVTRAGCTISSHCGRNTLGVLFIRKHPITQEK